MLCSLMPVRCYHGLLARPGTSSVQDFCLDRLREAGLSPVVPNADDRATIHRIIFDELCKARFAKRCVVDGIFWCCAERSVS